jgi:NTP pyrophosphatase (non-canonical NTP hydrolase)
VTDTTTPKTLHGMQADVRAVNEANGWHDDTERTFGDTIALLHSEVSEAFEAYRDWGFEDVTITEHEKGCTFSGATHAEGNCPWLNGPMKPEGVGSEFADILIRLLDSAERHGIDLEAEYQRKLAHNRTRGYRHGGKRV